MNKPTLKPYTLPSRSKSPPHDQNLSKSMSLPTLRKMLTKSKETEGMKKAKPITKAIKIGAFVVESRFVARLSLFINTNTLASKSLAFLIRGR